MYMYKIHKASHCLSHKYWCFKVMLIKFNKLTRNFGKSTTLTFMGPQECCAFGLYLCFLGSVKIGVKGTECRKLTDPQPVIFPITLKLCSNI